MLQPSTQQKLGALRSDITITLHSRMGTQIWNGRQNRYENGKITHFGIPSMPRVLKNLTQIQRDAENDDPFADYVLLKFEEAVLAHRQTLQQMMSELGDRYAADIPEGIDISRCENITPVTYQILANSQLGFKLIYLLNDFDIYARTVATAQHIALITRAEATTLNDKAASLLRKCFSLVESYRHSGVTRQDAFENNARYQDACQRFKLTALPQGVLDGTLRAEFAPAIRYPSQKSAETESKVEKVANSEAEIRVIEIQNMSQEV